MSYCEQVFLIIIDKLLIGLIIVIIGFIINRLLENHRLRNSIIKEFTNTKIKKISSIWKLLIDLEELAKELIEKIDNIRMFISIKDDQTRKILEDCKEQDDELLIKIKMFDLEIKYAHFWIGDFYYKKFNDLKNNISIYYASVYKGDIEKIPSIKDSILRLKKELISLDIKSKY